MIKKISFLLMLLLILISCEKAEIAKLRPFDIKDLKDVEDNDTINNPNEVTTQGPIIGYFNKKDNDRDKDYYKVYFSHKNTSYKIIQTAVPGIDSKITFFNDSKKRLFYIDNGKRGEAEKLWEYYPASDSIIMLVESKTGSNEEVPYVINFIPKIDSDINEVEPNNSPENAIPIEIGDEFKGMLSPKGDVDYYKILSSDDINYDFFIRVNTYSNLDINFTLYNLLDNSSKIINYSGWGEKNIYHISVMIKVIFY